MEALLLRGVAGYHLCRWGLHKSRLAVGARQAVAELACPRSHWLG